jgi:hypothetical protein
LIYFLLFVNQIEYLKGLSLIKNFIALEDIEINCLSDKIKIKFKNEVLLREREKDFYDFEYFVDFKINWNSEFIIVNFYFEFDFEFNYFKLFKYYLIILLYRSHKAILFIFVYEINNLPFKLVLFLKLDYFFFILINFKIILFYLFIF